MNKRIIDFLKVRVFAYPLMMLMAIPLARVYITHSELGGAFTPRLAVDFMRDVENPDNPLVFPMPISGLIPFYTGDGTIDITITPRIVRGLFWMAGISDDDIEKERKRQALLPPQPYFTRPPVSMPPAPKIDTRGTI